MNEKLYYLAFSNFSGIGPIKFQKLIKYFGSAENAWKAPLKEIELILKISLSEKFDKFRVKFDFEECVKQLKVQKISFVCLADKEYPELLKKIPNPPIVLYAKGNIKILKYPKGTSFSEAAQFQDDNKAIAIVGTRHITSYGRQITEMFAGDLAKAGLLIVSGMAYGVDGVAHKMALNVGGKTIAVLGNGVDQAYPRENQKLYEEILDSSGLILSEYPPGTPPSVGSFPARNRIVAGMSDGVLVTEGASDSGSLITANYGLDFSRKVFAVPGPITSSLSAAPLRLIERGAKLVVSPDDILREFKIQKSKGKIESKKFESLDTNERRIVELIENEPLQFDVIARRLKIDSSKLGTILSMMEIKGLIKNSGGNYSIFH